MTKKLSPYMLLIVLLCLAKVSVGQWATGQDQESASDYESASKLLKTYDVDGVATGYLMEEVVKKWGLEDVEITEKPCYRLTGPRYCLNERCRSAPESEKSKYRQLSKEWRELCPKRYEVKKDYLSASFNHKRMLCNFDVSKVYDGNYDPRDILEKLINKYGIPDYRGKPINIDEIISARNGSTAKTIGPLVFYRALYDKFYFRVRYRPARSKAVLHFSAYDHYLCKYEPEQANEELKEQLWNKYFPVVEESDASEIQF